MKYYTGTTVECLFMILRDGYLKTKPPHRVWEEYSEEYVYFVPFDERNEEEALESLRYAKEQATFAIAELDHTKRVVLEISGIQEDLLEEDDNAKGINAVQYPKDVSISCIDRIYIEHIDYSHKNKQLVAVTEYFRKQQDKTIKRFLIEDLYYTEDEEKNALYQQIGIKHLETINPSFLLDEGELESLYYDLLEELDYNSCFREVLLEEFLMTNVA